MSTMTLYHAPFACSKVSLNALEESGIDYNLELVNIFKGANKEPAYKAINPKGKVPALVTDGQLLTENAAIQLYLDRKLPEAKLLPGSSDAIARAQEISDLIWCSATMHPMVRQIRAPMRYTDGDTTDIQTKGRELFTDAIGMINARLGKGDWWFADQWSVVDVYLNWLYASAELGGYDLSPYTAVTAHNDRVRARDSYQSSLARERQALADEGLQLPAGIELF